MRKLVYMDGDPATGKTTAANGLKEALEANHPGSKVEIASDFLAAHVAFEMGADVVILDPDGKPFEVEVRYFLTPSQAGAPFEMKFDSGAEGE
jgi:hypothetical protein